MTPPELGNLARSTQLEAEPPSLRKNAVHTALRALGPFDGAERP